MSPLVHLLLAATALHAACGAAVPAVPAAPADLTAELQDVAPVAVANIEQIAVIKDENELRSKPEIIPVAVLIEDSQPAIKTNEVADDDEEIKRPAVDLRNPGPPQRQEHETQNADHFPDAKEKLTSVRDTIMQTQDLLRQGIQGVGNDISNWLSTNQQMNQIQQNIQSLRESFTLQIEKLNEAAKGLAAPQALKTEESPEETKPQSDHKDIEKRIKILENNFNNGVRALTEGVSIAAILRAEDESAAAAEAAPAAPPAVTTAATPTSTSPPFLIEYISYLQHTMSDSLRNVTQAFANNFPVVSNLQNLFNRTTSTLAPGVQADTPEGTTSRPGSPWQNFQFPNFGNLFGQAQTGPISGIQNAFQNVIGFVIPSTAKPNIASPAGSNSVPQKLTEVQKPEVPAATPTIAEPAQAPAAADPAPTTAAAAPAPAPAAPLGPIQQILTNNPVVQSITSTVQRIQSSITNPEKPRDTEKSEDLTSKGGYGKPPASGSGDDSNSGLSGQAAEPVKDVIPEEPKKPDDKIISPEVVKTE